MNWERILFFTLVYAAGQFKNDDDNNLNTIAFKWMYKWIIMHDQCWWCSFCTSRNFTNFSFNVCGWDAAISFVRVHLPRCEFYWNFCLNYVAFRSSSLVRIFIDDSFLYRQKTSIDKESIKLFYYIRCNKQNFVQLNCCVNNNSSFLNFRIKLKKNVRISFVRAYKTMNFGKNTYFCLGFFCRLFFFW